MLTSCSCTRRSAASAPTASASASCWCSAEMVVHLVKARPRAPRGSPPGRRRRRAAARAPVLGAALGGSVASGGDAEPTVAAPLGRCSALERADRRACPPQGRCWRGRRPTRRPASPPSPPRRRRRGYEAAAERVVVGRGHEEGGPARLVVGRLLGRRGGGERRLRHRDVLDRHAPQRGRRLRRRGRPRAPRAIQLDGAARRCSGTREAARVELRRGGGGGGGSVAATPRCCGWWAVAGAQAGPARPPPRRRLLALLPGAEAPGVGRKARVVFVVVVWCVCVGRGPAGLTALSSERAGAAARPAPLREHRVKLRGDAAVVDERVAVHDQLAQHLRQEAAEARTRAWVCAREGWGWVGGWVGGDGWGAGAGGWWGRGKPAAAARATGRSRARSVVRHAERLQRGKPPLAGSVARAEAASPGCTRARATAAAAPTRRQPGRLGAEGVVAVEALERSEAGERGGSAVSSLDETSRSRSRGRSASARMDAVRLLNERLSTSREGPPTGTVSEARPLQSRSSCSAGR